jgi:hypothetical protein
MQNPHNRRLQINEIYLLCYLFNIKFVLTLGVYNYCLIQNWNIRCPRVVIMTTKESRQMRGDRYLEGFKLVVIRSIPELGSLHSDTIMTPDA